MSHDGALFLDAAQRAVRYLETLDDRSIAPSRDALASLDQLRQPLPDTGRPGSEILDQLDRIGSPATMATNGGRFFGFVIGGAHPAALAAHCLSLAWDQNVGPRVLSPIGAVLEEVVTDWILDLFSLPGDCGTGFVTGAGMATFTALAAARRALLLRQRWDVDADGLYGAPRLRVVTSAEIHPTVIKALGLLGLGRRQIEPVPCDDQGRIRLDAMPPLDDRTILCVQAGNINSGAFDPFLPLSEKAREAGAWLHVDGAFGLWAAASDRHKTVTDGMDRADSWATDGHKWLNLPYENAVAIVRDKTPLIQAMSIRAPYLLNSGEREPYDTTPGLSRRIRGADWWAALQALGRRGVTTQIDRSCAQARQMAATLQSAGWTLLNDVVLNQVCAIPPNAQPERTATLVQNEGTCWVGPTVWQGRSAIRLSVSSVHTSEKDVEKSLQALIRAGAK